MVFVSHKVPFPATSDRRSRVAGNGTEWEVKTIELSLSTSGGEQWAFPNFKPVFRPTMTRPPHSFFAIFHRNYYISQNCPTVVVQWNPNLRLRKREFSTSTEENTDYLTVIWNWLFAAISTKRAKFSQQLNTFHPAISLSERLPSQLWEKYWIFDQI